MVKQKKPLVVTFHMTGDGLHLVKLADRQFVLDNRTFSPKSYFLGLPTQVATVDMVDIRPDDKRFGVRQSSLGTLGLVTFSQVLVKSLSSMIKQSYFLGKTGDIFWIKLFILLLTVGFSYLIYLFLASRRDKRVATKWPTTGTRWRVTFRPTNKPQFELVHAFIALLCFSVLLYWLWLPDALILVGLFSIVVFYHTQRLFPIGSHHSQDRLIIENIEKIS